MKYFAAYNQDNRLSIGKLFNSVDEVVEAATITLLDYFDDKSNETTEIFGMDIEAYFEERIGDKYQFSVYQFDEDDAISYVRTTDLWRVARNSQESIITKGMLTISNNTIRTELIEPTSVAEYYLRIVSNLENLQRIVYADRAREFIVDTYISIIKLGQITDIKREVLKYEYYPQMDLIEVLGTIARGLLEGNDISHTLNILIYYIWGLAEMVYEIDFVECISEEVKHRAELHRVAS